MYKCSMNEIQLWIKLHRPEQNESNQRLIQQLRRLSLQQDMIVDRKNSGYQQEQLRDQYQRRRNKEEEEKNSNYISPIFSLEKIPKAQKIKNSMKKSGLRITQRLLFHNYTKFKTTPFTYRRLTLPEQYSSSLSIDLAKQLFQQTIVKRNNSCLLALGSKNAGIQTTLQQRSGGNDPLLYEIIIKLAQHLQVFNQNQRLNKSHHTDKNHLSTSKNGFQTPTVQDQIPDRLFIESSVNFLLVTQTKVIDLLNLNNNQIFLRQHSTQQPHCQPLVFQNANQCSFLSPYQLYTTFKLAVSNKKLLKTWGVFIVKVNYFFNKDNRTQNIPSQSILLIEWAKDTHSSIHHYESKPSSSTGQKFLLCLNQCILERLKLIQSQKPSPKQQSEPNKIQNPIFFHQDISKISNLQSFRNSLITRIIKPYLLFDSQFIFLAFCSVLEENQNDSYQTLMLGKHLANLFTLKIEQKVTQNDKSTYVQQNLESAESQRKSNHLKTIQKPVFNIKSQDQSHIQDPKVHLKKPIIFSQKKKQSTFSLNRRKSFTPNTDIISKQPSTTPCSSASSPVTLKKQQLIRQQLSRLLQQSEEKKKNTEQYEFRQVQKKILQQKEKTLKTRKQLNLLKAKQNARSLTYKITHSDEKNLSLINQQINRLTAEQKILESQLHRLKLQQQSYMDKLISQTGEQDMRRQKLQLIRQKLTTDLAVTELQIDEFINQKQSVKSILMGEISRINKRQKQLKSLNNSRKVQTPLISPYKINKTLNTNSAVNKSKPSNQTYNKSNKRILKNLTLDPRPNKYEYQSLDLDEIKKSRLFIRKRTNLKQKVNKGRIEYASFLQKISNQYIRYSPQKVPKN